jgi:AcrR family transcriptional regulator
VARPPDPALKERLLDEVVAYLAANGLGLLSLRPLAAALNTSTNRLVHHFGTKEELIDAALARALAIQESVQNKWLADDPNISEANLLRRWWSWICASPQNMAIVRLGLEAAALDATLTGISSTVREQQIGVWRTLIERRLRTEGLSADDAALEASMLKATFTGLSIDLMATGDRTRLGAALEETLVRLERRYGQVESSQSARTPPQSSKK